MGEARLGQLPFEAVEGRMQPLRTLAQQRLGEIRAGGQALEQQIAAPLRAGVVAPEQLVAQDAAGGPATRR